MKTLITITSCLLFTVYTGAQTKQIIKTDEGQSAVAITEKTNSENMPLKNSSNLDVKTTGTNANYLNITNYMDNPEYVKRLENTVAQYNIKNSEFYDSELSGKNEGYNMAFSTEQSYVEVKYNLMGEIIYSNERFKDIALPTPVVIKIMQDYPDWELLNNTCEVNYKKDIGVTRSYKVKIKKENLKKTLKLDEMGNQI